MRSADRVPHRGERGFSLVELSVVALLVAVLLLIAGQIFVELIRRQEDYGRAFAATEGFVPWDAFLARDAREAADTLPSWQGKTKSDRVVLLKLPSEADGKELVAVWEFGAETGAKRTLYRGETAAGVHEFTTGGYVHYEENGLGAGRLLFQIEVYPRWDPSPTARPAAVLSRTVACRNITG